MSKKVAVVVPWHNPDQREKFDVAWGYGIDLGDSGIHLLMVEDREKRGCAATKNLGVARALEVGADVVVVIDDDCFPTESCRNLYSLVSQHLSALEPIEWCPQFMAVTNPPSRGTPYNLPKTTPVAASMGFWEGIGDYDAANQLVRGANTPMLFEQTPIFGAYFPLSGMNIAFRPREWLPWCQFIDVPRFDDIWCGFLWQKEAWRRGYCFNTRGPIVKHVRQSNVFKNLRDEAKWLEVNETLWQTIAQHPSSDYDTLRALLPV